MPNITDNLVAWWKLDETSGTTATDSSGSGYDGTYVNSPTLNQTGAFGASKAVAFASASSQYIVNSAPTGMLKNVSAATVSLWIKNSTVAAQSFVEVGAGSNTSRLNVSCGSSGNIRINARAGDAESVQTVTHTAVTTDGLWHHFVGVVDYANDTITLYKDGVQVSTTGTVSFTASTTSNTDPSAARVATLVSSQFANATLDDVRIYSRALSAADAAALYAYTGSAPVLTARHVGPMQLGVGI